MTLPAVAGGSGSLGAVAAVWRLSPGAPAARVPAAHRHRHPVPVLRHDARGRRRGARRPARVAALQPRRRLRAGARVAYVIVRARLPRARAPVWLVFGVLGALWAYNIVLNPTFN